MLCFWDLRCWPPPALDDGYTCWELLSCWWTADIWAVTLLALLLAYKGFFACFELDWFTFYTWFFILKIGSPFSLKYLNLNNRYYLFINYKFKLITVEYEF